MKPPRKRLVGVAVALSAVAIAAPLSTASAAALRSRGPVPGQAAEVIGPLVVTTAPSTFVDTNTQVSAGGASAGVQLSP